VEATYLRLFETVGQGLGLSQHGLKVILSGFPLMSCCGGHPRDRTREAEDRAKRNAPVSTNARQADKAALLAVAHPA
jgi:hypothetical protein